MHNGHLCRQEGNQTGLGQHPTEHTGTGKTQRQEKGSRAGGSMHSETSQVGVEPKQELGGPRSAEREGGGGAFPAGGQRRLEPDS